MASSLPLPSSPPLLSKKGSGSPKRTNSYRKKERPVAVAGGLPSSPITSPGHRQTTKAATDATKRGSHDPPPPSSKPQAVAATSLKSSPIPGSRRQSIERALHGRTPRLRKHQPPGPEGQQPPPPLWQRLCCCLDAYMSYLDCLVGCPCATVPVYSLSSEAAKHKKLFTSLGLSENDVGIFYIYFRRIDVDSSGTITTDELLNYLGFDSNRFTKRVFSIFDEDNSGTIDFSLVLFAFDLYDKDTSGQLELSEIEKLLLEVYGSEYYQNPYAKNIVVELHERMAAALSGMPVFMNIHDFGALCKRHPALLMPAFLYQDAIRHRICGPRFWSRCADIRFKLSDGEYVPIGVLMEAAVNKKVALGIAAAEQAKQGKQKEKQSQAVRFLKNIGGIKALRQSSSNLNLSPSSTTKATGATHGSKVAIDEGHQQGRER